MMVSCSFCGKCVISLAASCVFFCTMTLLLHSKATCPICSEIECTLVSSIFGLYAGILHLIAWQKLHLSRLLLTCLSDVSLFPNTRQVSVAQSAYSSLCNRSTSLYTKIPDSAAKLQHVTIYTSTLFGESICIHIHAQHCCNQVTCVNALPYGKSNYSA